MTFSVVLFLVRDLDFVDPSFPLRRMLVLASGGWTGTWSQDSSSSVVGACKADRRWSLNECVDCDSYGRSCCPTEPIIRSLGLDLESGTTLPRTN